VRDVSLGRYAAHPSRRTTVSALALSAAALDAATSRPRKQQFAWEIGIVSPNSVQLSQSNNGAALEFDLARAQQAPPLRRRSTC